MASIHARGPRKDGTYSYTLAWRDRDTRKQERWTHQTREEAEMWQRLIEANGESLARAEKVYKDSNTDGPTVAESITTHINQLVGTTEYTVKRYHDAVRLHFSGTLGQMKVKSVSQDSVIDWIKWMELRPRSPKTISLQHGLLSAAMETAVRQRVIDRNPCSGVRLPKDVRIGDDGDDITLEDFKAIRTRTDRHFHPFLDFLVGAGCRFSEATPLMAKDFHLDAAPPLVMITKAHKLAAAGGRYVGEPKTKKSRRRVSLAPSTVAAVRPLVEAAAVSGGPVFQMREGGEFTAQAFYNKSWEKARREAGLGIGSEKHVTVHSIRHLHAAIMLAAGMDMYKLSTRMGHSSIQVTVDLYAHLLPDAHFQGAAFAHKALGGAVPEVVIEAAEDPDDEDAA
ncbi:site-specific integrase [Arthrobacter sp. ISL-69]|uniref:tyrosine-type recombinase/integrase n=1 Tax=Arthrobacter sp. ISL-69 TaxID=2819113 RepID=UPI001BE6091F|nr:site-specific integrase [Arthrobacter sp. ISL-69]MBT2537184.1 site-specific integrase [Arthrobacter sp. ISL-69]